MQTPFEGFHLQVIHKYIVPLFEGCQTPFEGFHLEVMHEYSASLSDRCQLLLRILFTSYT